MSRRQQRAAGGGTEPGLGQRLMRWTLAATLAPTIILGGAGLGVLLLLSSRSATGPLTGTDFDNAALALLLVTVTVSAAAALAVYWSTRRLAAGIIGPIRELQVEADRLAVQDLPRLVDGLRSTDGSGEIPAVDLIDIDATGEVADLAASFNALRTATIDTVASQTIGRSRDLAGVLVNLGRRNQRLIGRQLQLIDRLEATESDPDMLRHLFTLDQMATRMRRNAESLLVLAGERVDRQIQIPLPVDEVLRAATSEVEAYHRVTQSGVEPATISPRAVSDLTHLLAELIENATGFSESDRPVVLMGRWEERGGYTISVVDEGVGMSHRRLAEANRRITSSAVGDHSPTSYLGLFVVGRLAARHRIDARLVEAAPSGTIAKVTLPPRLVSERSSVPDEPVHAPSPHHQPGAIALGLGPPPVESTLAPITGPIPRITVNDPATVSAPPPAPRPRRPRRPATAHDDLPAAADEHLTRPDADGDLATNGDRLPAAADEDLTRPDADGASQRDEALPIPPFRTRPSLVDRIVAVPERAADGSKDCSGQRPVSASAGFDHDEASDGEEPYTARHPSSTEFGRAIKGGARQLEVVPDHDDGAGRDEARAAEVRDRLAGFSQGVAAALVNAATPDPSVPDAADHAAEPGSADQPETATTDPTTDTADPTATTADPAAETADPGAVLASASAGSATSADDE